MGVEYSSYTVNASSLYPILIRLNGAPSVTIYAVIRADPNFSCITGRSVVEFPLVLIRLMATLQMCFKFEDDGLRNSDITLGKLFSGWFLTTSERVNQSVYDFERNRN